MQIPVWSLQLFKLISDIKNKAEKKSQLYFL